MSEGERETFGHGPVGISHRPISHSIPTGGQRPLEADIARSHLMEEGGYDKKPWWFRLGVRVAALTSPIQ